MGGTIKFDIKKFNRSYDFDLWKIKMHIFMVQQDLVNALKGESILPATTTTQEKEELIEKAKSVIILCLGGKSLKEVAREPTTTRIKIEGV